MGMIGNTSLKDAAKLAALSVLLVDDHPSIRSIITGILNALGVTKVTTAERGDVAITHLSTGSFDLLITDFEMPGMTGGELAKLVRQEARSATPSINFKIPILLITGNVTRKRINEARDAGIDEILAKPFTVLAVADRLNSVLNKRREFVVCPTYVGPCRRRITQAAYVGPLRRDCDMVELPSLEIEQERILLHKEAQALCKLGQSGYFLASGERESALAIALSGAQRAARIREPVLQRACMSLVTYIQWVAKTAQVECRFVDTHGLAILKLLELATSDPGTSEQVAQGLEDLVARRTRGKRAA